MADNKHRHKHRLAYWLALGGLVFFAGLFAYNVHGYFRYWQDGRQARRNAQVIQEIFADFVDDAALGVARADAYELLGRARQLTGSGNIVAYITIPGTNIGNMVVQGADNEHYLYHDIFGNANVNGALFMDFRNSADFSDPNTIIYGHNMRNGTMFHNLRYFVNVADFWQRHRNIYVVTAENTFIYEVFAAFSTNIDFDYIQVFFDSEEDFGALLAEIYRRNVINTGATPTTNDNILVLSTCTNQHQDTRFVVVGRLRK